MKRETPFFSKELYEISRRVAYFHMHIVAGFADLDVLGNFDAGRETSWYISAIASRPFKVCSMLSASSGVETDISARTRIFSPCSEM